MQSWIVSLPDRLDAFLAADGRMISRAKAQQAIEDGFVSVNDEVVKKVSTRLQEGDKVHLGEVPDAAELVTITPSDLHLTILYEDDACMVINKPAGISVHPGAGMAPGEKTILHGIAHVFKKKKIVFTQASVLVHRLDKETTGCLLIAKTPQSHNALQQQFQNRSVKKHYIALVAGVPKVPHATIDAPIGRNVRDRTTMAVISAWNSREAQTTYDVLKAGNDCAFLRCDLHTGRTHQIRVHLLSIGHPVLGDDTYTTPLSERLRDQFDIRCLCLHAEYISFTSPANKKKHEVTAEMPEGFKEVKKKMGL